ncbi:unnamed protein product [Caretta caretta]
MDIFNGEGQLDGDRGAPKSPFSGTSASSNSNLPGYSCHHVCNTSLCNWLGESGSQAGEACPAPEKTKCLGQNRYLFNGTRPRPSASGGMGPPCPGLKNRPWTPITLRPAPSWALRNSQTAPAASSFSSAVINPPYGHSPTLMGSSAPLPSCHRLCVTVRLVPGCPAPEVAASQRQGMPRSVWCCRPECSRRPAPCSPTSRTSTPLKRRGTASLGVPHILSST